jgi:hypothetical protein
MPNETTGEKPKTPKTVKTTTTSKRKALGNLRPRKEKTVEKVYSDYPLKRKNLVKKTTVVNKALPTKDVVKTKTVTNPTDGLFARPSRDSSGAVKTITKEKKTRNYIKGVEKEKKVTRPNVGVTNPLISSEKRQKNTVQKSVKKEKNNNVLWTPKKK